MSEENKGAPASAESNEVIDSGENESLENDSVENESLEVSAEDLPTAEEIDADPTLTKAEKKEAKKMLKELEIKYNGKTEKIQLPFEIPEEHADYMRRQAQMAKMGQSKAQEAAAWERDTMAFLNELKTNPRKVLSNPHLGVDLKKIAAEILEEELENAQKSPEQLEKEEYMKKLKEYEEKEAAREKEIEEMKKQKIIEDAYAQYDAAMTQAMEQYDIPKTPVAIYEMAHLMSLEIKRGYEPDMEAIAQIVHEKHSAVETASIEKLKKKSLAELKKLLGEEIFEQERKERVAKVKKTPVSAKQAAPDVGKTEKKEEKPAQKLAYKDFFGL